MNPIDQGRIDLAAVLRWSARLQLNEGVCNHYSLEVAGDRYLINPQGLHWSEVTAADILLIDGQGRIIEGRHSLEPTAFFIHSWIHRLNPQARCVLHTHMPYATALTLFEGGELAWCNQNALRFWDRIGYDRVYNGLALDEAEGRRIASALRAAPTSTPAAAPPCPAWAMAIPTCWPPCMRRSTGWPTRTPASSPPRWPRRWPTSWCARAGGHEPRLLRQRRLRGGGGGAEDGAPVLRRDRPAAAQHFIARRQSYHGNTLGALAVGGNEWRRRQFAPLLIDVTTCRPATNTATARRRDARAIRPAPGGRAGRHPPPGRRARDRLRRRDRGRRHRRRAGRCRATCAACARSATATACC
jgi:hypothetical protein